MIKRKMSSFKLIRELNYIPFFIILLMAMFVLPVSANDGNGANVKIANPGSDLWREVRQREGLTEGTTQVKGVDAGVLINTGGEAWRQLRVEQIIPYTGYLLGLTLLALIIFRLIRGNIKIGAGRSGEKLLRFSLNQRTIHWIVAGLFLILGLTGIILLLGRTILLPVIGSSGFSAIASVSKLIHDYCGPVFSIFLLIMFISFVKGNFYKLKDINWFLKGGGMLGKHASAGRYNAGEKSWFWLAMLGGIVIVISGLILDFPIFGQTRELLEQAQVFHVIASVVVLAASFGHIYMGTVAMEGALETMTTGYCDSNWAKEHHDEWYEEIKDLNETEDSNSTSEQATTTSDNSVKPV